MWQRIQTFYLILVIVLMAAGILLPNVNFYPQQENIFYQLDSRGIVEINLQDGAVEKVIATNPCTFIFGLILFLATFSIFNFKNRRKQMRFATASFFSIIIYIIALIVFVAITQSKLNVELLLEWPIVFPFIALIFNYLAMRGIAKDEQLVRSLDRLR